MPDQRLIECYIYHKGKWPYENENVILYWHELPIRKIDFISFGAQSYPVHSLFKESTIE